MNLSRRQIDLLSGAFQQDSRIAAAYLMGSVLKEHFRGQSDVDIAVLPAVGTKMSLMERLAIAAELSDIVCRSVDIGLLDTQDLIYAKEAIIDGLCIFCRDKYARLIFDMIAQEGWKDLVHFCKALGLRVEP